MSTLRQGNVNEDVAEMQRALATIDPKYKKLLSAHSNKHDDGIFGGDTKSAVMQFQKDNGLKPTGIVDDALQASIRELAAASIVATQPKSHASVVPDALERARLEASQVPNPSWKPATRTAQDIGAVIVAAAKQEVGNSETVGENRGVHIDRYRSASGNKADGSPWCADFVSYVANKTTPGLIKPTPMAAGVASQFKQHGSYHKNDSDYQPKSGDVIFFEHSDAKGRRISHVAFVDSVGKDGSIVAIEGNIADKKYDGLKEAEGWDKNAPDLVRVREWKPGDEKFGNRIVGFGSVAELAAAKGIVEPEQQQTYAQNQPPRPRGNGRV